MKKSSSTSAFNLTRLSEAGFTLIEILIAITLLAFITLGVVNITENAALTMERTTAINENNLMAETAFSRFDWDFSQIYSPLFFSTIMTLNPLASNAGNTGNPQNGQVPGQQPAGQISPELAAYHEQLLNRFQNNEHFMGVSQEGLPIPKYYFTDKSTFEFFTTSNRRKVQNVKQSHFAWVRYALAPQEEDPDEEKPENPGAASVPKNLRSLIRYFYPDDPYDDKRIDPDSDLVKGAVLLRNVESLEFQFWNLDTRKWETSLSTIKNGQSLLRGVRMLITWYDNNGVKRTADRIYRNPWPLVAPTDQPAAVNTNTQGQTTSGQTNGATTNNQGNLGF